MVLAPFSHDKAHTRRFLDYYIHDDSVGALIGGRTADRYGRKATIRLCSWLFLLGTALMALAPTYAVLILGRMVTGLGVGVAFVVAPVYISEVAPPAQRGALNTVFDVAINGGILAGYLTGYLVQVSGLLEHNKWRLMLGLGAVLPAIVLWLLPHLPESPRWFMLQHETANAASVLRRLGLSEAEVNSNLEAMGAELQITETAQDKSLCSPSKLLAVQLGFWQQITGTEAVLYYSADFLARAGLASPELRLLGNCGIGVCKLIPEYIAMQHVDNHGRRPYLIASSISLTTTTSLLAFAFWQDWPPMLVIVLLCAVMASFSGGLGPFTFLCASENLDLAQRASGHDLDRSGEPLHVRYCGPERRLAVRMARRPWPVCPVRLSRCVLAAVLPFFCARDGGCQSGGVVGRTAWATATTGASICG